MGIDRVKKYFSKFGMEDKIIEFDKSSATVLEASEVLGIGEEYIAKTLSFITDKPILIVMAGNVKIDNAKYRHLFKCKAKMIPMDEVESIIGHEVGGVCPFAINDGVDVYLDVSLKNYDYIYPACGSSNSAIKLTIPELEKYSNYKEWIDVTK